MPIAILFIRIFVCSVCFSLFILSLLDSDIYIVSIAISMDAMVPDMPANTSIFSYIVWLKKLYFELLTFKQIIKTNNGIMI